jgi:hypothetical protein
LSSVLYPDSDSDSAVDIGAMEEDTESLRPPCLVIVEAESSSSSSSGILSELDTPCIKEATVPSKDLNVISMAGVVGRLLSMTVSNAVEELLLVGVFIGSFASDWSLSSGRAVLGDGGTDGKFFFRGEGGSCRPSGGGV